MTSTISQLKKDACAEWKLKTVEERLKSACWNEPYYNIKPTDKYGLLFGFQVRVWIDRQGNVYATKPAK